MFFKYDLKKSVKEPRFHNQLKPNVTMVEQDFEKVAHTKFTNKREVFFYWREKSFQDEINLDSTPDLLVLT